MRRGRPRSDVTVDDVLAALALRRASGVATFDVDLAADLDCGRDTIRRRLREAGLSLAILRTAVRPMVHRLTMSTETTAPDPTTVVQLVHRVTCVACGETLPRDEATGLFHGAQPQAIAWVHRAYASSACLRRAAAQSEAIAA